MRHRVVASFTLAVFAVGLASCAQNLVQVRESPATEAAPISAVRIAVLPFRGESRPGAGALRADAPALVASYVAEAFAARGVDTVPPSDVLQALGGPAGDIPLGSLATLVRDRFGAEALAIGRVYRFRERSGEALGSTRPASVGFEVRILSAPDGRVLWTGVFDHTQVALGDNALTAAQYPGGGTRWLTSEELARWGAGRVVRTVPMAQSGP